MLLPYAVLRTCWALGLGISPDGFADVHAEMAANSGPVISAMYRYGIDFRTLLALVASLLALALVRSWGTRFPAALLLAPACLGGLALGFAGAAGLVLLLGLTGAPVDLDGIDHPWVFVLVYGGFLGGGIAACGAALACARHSRGRQRAA
jgi:hypothetical protein